MMVRTQKDVQNMRLFVDLFYKHMIQTLNEMRARHLQEELIVLKRLYVQHKGRRKVAKKEAKANKKRSKEEDHDGEYHLSDLINLMKRTSKA